MILDFRGKDYKCEYYAGNCFHSGACFSNGCDEGKIKGYFYVTITWAAHEQAERNYCFLDKKALIEYFTEISRLMGFKLISLTESKNLYKLQIRCVADNRYFIYCSMLVRYVYEFPFSILLYAAWQNRKNFPELDIIQIMQFYIATVYSNRYCHCPGHPGFAFTNINSKCQFSLIRSGFNYHSSFYRVETEHGDLYISALIFNTKQLPQIVSGINSIVNKYYAKNKKRICRW